MFTFQQMSIYLYDSPKHVATTLYCGLLVVLLVVSFVVLSIMPLVFLSVVPLVSYQ